MALMQINAQQAKTMSWILTMRTNDVMCFSVIGSCRMELQRQGFQQKGFPMRPCYLINITFRTL